MSDALWEKCDELGVPVTLLMKPRSFEGADRMVQGFVRFQTAEHNEVTYSLIDARLVVASSEKTLEPGAPVGRGAVKCARTWRRGGGTVATPVGQGISGKGTNVDHVSSRSLATGDSLMGRWMSAAVTASAMAATHMPSYEPVRS